jgi:hypothetical protein
MSLRKVARILDISPTYLSVLLNRKRPWRGNLRERYEELVNTFVPTLQANTSLTKASEDGNVTEKVEVLPIVNLVELGGLEPPTSSMPLKRSPS